MPIVDPIEDAAVDNLVNQGIVCAIAAGNDRDNGAGVSSPGSASAAITVAALGNNNQISEYSSYGTSDAAGNPTQSKPDVAAPGGSFPELISVDSSGKFTGLTSANPADSETITSVDSNTADYDETGPVEQQDLVPNDYTNEEGTSMATPHVAGSVALVEQALDLPGALSGQKLSGGGEAKFIKALLEMTATETNKKADQDTKSVGGAAATPLNANAPSPKLDRGGKDVSEGYGKINDDAALSAVMQSYLPGNTATDSFNSGPMDKQAWARNVSLTGGAAYKFTLAAGSDDASGTEYDLYLYSITPTDDGSVSNGAVGEAKILASSVTAGTVAQSISYTPAANEVDILIVKRVAGSGSFKLTSTGGSVAAQTVTVTDASSGAPIQNAVVTADNSSTGQQYSNVTTGTNGTAVASVPQKTGLNLTATALGYYQNTVSAATGTDASSAAVQLSPSHVFQPGLQMISAPAGYSASFEDVTLPHIFATAVWSPTALGYVLTPSAPADTFHLGQAYWVRLRQPASIIQRGSAATPGSFSIPLSAGWNMVGSPYANPSSLASATVTMNGASSSFANAASTGNVSLLYSYDPASNGYVTVPATGTMAPYAGYWIHAKAAGNLVVSGS